MMWVGLQNLNSSGSLPQDTDILSVSLQGLDQTGAGCPSQQVLSGYLIRQLGTPRLTEFSCFMQLPAPCTLALKARSFSSTQDTAQSQDALQLVQSPAQCVGKGKLASAQRARVKHRGGRATGRKQDVSGSPQKLVTEKRLLPFNKCP